MIDPAENENINRLSNRVIGAALEVHKQVGPGLLESIYEGCLCRELTLQGIPYLRQVMIPVHYKGIELPHKLKLDVLVDDALILELKSQEKIEPIHEAQLLTYLRLTGKWLGLLINFNVGLLRDGIHRIING